MKRKRLLDIQVYVGMEVGGCPWNYLETVAVYDWTPVGSTGLLFYSG